MNTCHKFLGAVALCGALGSESVQGATIAVDPPGSADQCVVIAPGDFTLVIRVSLSDSDPGTEILAATDFDLDGLDSFATFAYPNPEARWGDTGDMGVTFGACAPTEVVLWSVNVFGYDGSPLAIRAAPSWLIGCPHVTTCGGAVLCAETPVLCVNNPGCCTSMVTPSTWTKVKTTYK